MIALLLLLEEVEETNVILWLFAKLNKRKQVFVYMIPAYIPKRNSDEIKQFEYC